jgi:hypothetical protein
MAGEREHDQAESDEAELHLHVECGELLLHDVATAARTPP